MNFLPLIYLIQPISFLLLLQNDKNAQLKKRWLNLKNSNLSEIEYRKKEKELKQSEQSEIHDIKEDIYNKLCASKTKGFETKDSIYDQVQRIIDKNPSEQILKITLEVTGEI